MVRKSLENLENWIVSICGIVLKEKISKGDFTEAVCAS